MPEGQFSAEYVICYFQGICNDDLPHSSGFKRCPYNLTVFNEISHYGDKSYRREIWISLSL